MNIEFLIVELHYRLLEIPAFGLHFHPASHLLFPSQSFVSS